MHENEQQTRNNGGRKKLVLLGTGITLVLLAAGGLLWQWSTINHLKKEVTDLKKTSLPQKQYTSYEDCMGNGGAVLWTINAGFSGCLGGNEAASGEMPEYQAFLQYSAQNLPRIEERKKASTENKVTANGSYSADLLAFLKSDYTGCQPRGEYEVVKEVKDRFALMKYGCDGDGQVQSKNPPTMIAMKLSDGWVLLSPTNNMEGNTPSCLLVDMFKISKELSDKCFENTGYNNGTQKDVTYQ